MRIDRRLRRPQPMPRDIYTDWWWPPSPTVSRTIPAGYSSFEHVVVPEVDPGAGTAYMWAHHFKLVGAGGGYVGIGVATAAKVAALCISDPVPHTSRPDAPTGARSGGKCVVSFDWRPGEEYVLQVWTDRTGSWSAVAADRAGRETLIGRIQVPVEWRGLASSSVMSTEYHGGALDSCDRIPASSVVFGTPTADGGRVTPEQSQSRLGQGTCETSSVKPVPGGVRHQVGRPSGH